MLTSGSGAALVPEPATHQSIAGPFRVLVLPTHGVYLVGDRQLHTVGFGQLFDHLGRLHSLGYLIHIGQNVVDTATLTEFSTHSRVSGLRAEARCNQITQAGQAGVVLLAEGSG